MHLFKAQSRRVQLCGYFNNTEENILEVITKTSNQHNAITDNKTMQKHGTEPHKTGKILTRVWPTANYRLIL